MYRHIFELVSSTKGYLFHHLSSFSIPALRERQLEQNELIWDKDCDIDLDFVVASTNLRAHLFSIPLKSKFDIKCENLV